MTERISLEGKVAVVTGAGAGWGGHTSNFSSERGARVVVNDWGLTYRGSGGLHDSGNRCRTSFGHVEARPIANGAMFPPLKVATTDRNDRRALRRIDLLVNNAGICGSQLFEHATLDDFDHYWRVHLRAGQHGEGCLAAYGSHSTSGRSSSRRQSPPVRNTWPSHLRGGQVRGSRTDARSLQLKVLSMGILVNTISPNGYTRNAPGRGIPVGRSRRTATMPVEAVAPAYRLAGQRYIVRRRTASTTVESRNDPAYRDRHGTWLLRSTL